MSHKWDRNYRVKKYVSYWPAQISALFFVLFMYALIKDDFETTLSYHPVLYNFFIGTIILALTIVLWKNPKRTNGFYFIAVGFVYYFLMWDRILAVSVIATSVWLILTGALFLISPTKEKVILRKHKRNLKNKFVSYINRCL